MKYSIEKVYKKDGERMFNLGLNSLINKLGLPGYTERGIHQYQEKDEHITVHITKELITFHVLTVDAGPTILGKIKLSGETDAEADMWNDLEANKLTDCLAV